jgi:ribosomal-protein-alanine N-acetyltransferase
MPGWPVGWSRSVNDLPQPETGPLTGPPRLDETATMAALHAASWPRPWSQADFTRFLDEPGMVCLVARDPLDGFTVQGLCVFQHAAQEAELLMIAVDPMRRRQGIGLQLLKAGLARLQAQAQAVSTCFLEVAESNPAARGLYQTLGFADVGRRKAYYPPATPGSPADDAIIMRLDLSTLC